MNGEGRCPSRPAVVVVGARRRRVMNSEGRCLSRLGWSTPVVAVLVLAAACGSPDIDETAETAALSTSATVAEVEDAAPAPEASAPATSLSEVSAPTTSLPEVSVPTTSVPEVSAPTTTVPEVSVPTTPVPEVSAPEVPASTTTVAETEDTESALEVSVPTTSVPSTAAPTTSVPTVSVPTTSVPAVSLPVAAEYEVGYDRDDWGPHNSGLCRGAVGSPDPYTGTPIDTCNVDHVVALHEAHESGGWAWPGDQKQRFSQDPGNHAASRACVNQSKGGDDISEWSDADIARSLACGGGYRVTAAGRCFLAATTVAVKAAWGLAADQAEADALGATLSGCGDQAPELAVVPQDTTAAPPPTAAAGECLIAGKTAAQYDAVPGIGEVLSARLVDAQPFSSRSALESVSGIGPARSEAVWSHFCGS